ncbi:MAG: putative TrmH family tRNA/rRNA methyltransferase [Eubacteriales bacterium SKADARSKE-1]|nr:putative TrmH family tRNA/rRNA methyltransferase [Eubacteriales bacterium SKADARSKE-1]
MQLNNPQKETDLIVGRNVVKEALISGREIEYIMVSKGEKKGSIVQIILLAKKHGIIIKEVDNKKLDFLSPLVPHQGIAALVSAHKYSTVDDILNVAVEKNEPAFIIIADGIEDPHNLGAIIRTAECAGAHGVIIPKRHSAGLTTTVLKSAAGALEYIKVARVTNISTIIDELKQKGLWIYCADMNGTPWHETNLTGPVGLVIGNEGFGVSKLVKENCDVMLSLPLCGKISSLNASVAAGVLMYEINRQRHLQNTKI